MDNYEELAAKIARNGAKRILVQLPEGLKMKSIDVCNFLQQRGFDVILSNDATYGACDLADYEAKQLGCDLLVHIGHSKFYVDFKTDVPVLYYIWPEKITIDSIDFSNIKEKRIGILTSIQHMEILSEAKKLLEHHGKEAVIGGQILGCWTANADKIMDKVDAFLFIGSGEFHPLAVNGKKIYRLDLEKKEISEVDVDKFNKLRYGNIFRAKDAKTFGILVSSKKGQRGLLARAERVRSCLEQKHKKAFIIVMNEITDEKLLGLKVDAFINTACPRITDMPFSKPVINANDLDVLLEE
ncbi:MAG: diphthamide biosynthesis enzyme Dph2 [Candidatus Aenigmarchaeota archaeon]|nr:diphthamide biosynthesis enzyme Dph2 [Candidatus Aenigmarchaeota archaeon]MDI6722162.1 diphthamide biosynthesis enzyme Dph2 [Candidatus Aenigmarchaeota archaeon]